MSYPSYLCSVQVTVVLCCTTQTRRVNPSDVWRYCRLEIKGETQMNAWKGGERTNVLNLHILTLVRPSSPSYLGTSMDREVSRLPLVTGRHKTPNLLTFYGAWDRNKESSLIVITMFYFCSCFVCVCRPWTLQIFSPSSVNLVAKAGQRGWSQKGSLSPQFLNQHTHWCDGVRSSFSCSFSTQGLSHSLGTWRGFVAPH